MVKKKILQTYKPRYVAKIGPLDEKWIPKMKKKGYTEMEIEVQRTDLYCKDYETKKKKKLKKFLKRVIEEQDMTIISFHLPGPLLRIDDREYTRLNRGKELAEYIENLQGKPLEAVIIHGFAFLEKDVKEERLFKTRKKETARLLEELKGWKVKFAIENCSRSAFWIYKEIMSIPKYCIKMINELRIDGKIRGLVFDMDHALETFFSDCLLLYKNLLFGLAASKYKNI